MRLSRDIIDRALDWDVGEANVLRRWYVTAADRTIDYVLAHVVDGMDRLVTWYEGTVVVDVFPRPDAFLSNEFLRIRGDGGLWSAELCGRPDRHFGEIPERLQDILIDHGWRADAEIDRNFQRVACRECGFVHPCDWVYEQPADSSSYDVVAHVSDAARLIHDAPDGEWFVQASVYNARDEVGEITRRSDLHHSFDGLAIDCVVNLVELLPLDPRSPLVRRALWPNDSYWAEWACYLEVHDAHEGPCPLDEFPDDDWDDGCDDGNDDENGDPNGW
jgi:hypothetical protein